MPAVRIVLAVFLIAAIVIAIAVAKRSDGGQTAATSHANTSSAVKNPQPTKIEAAPTKPEVGSQPSAAPAAPVASQPTNPPPAPTAAEPPSAPGAVLCVNATCDRFDADTADFSNTEIGRWDVGSLSQVNGVRVSLFTEQNFQGNCQTFTSPVDNFYSIGASPTSLWINKDCPAGAVLCVNATCHRFDADTANFSDTNIGRWDVGSLSQVNGVRVSLFTEQNFQGNCQTFTSPVDNFYSLGASPKSLRINKDCP